MLSTPATTSPQLRRPGALAVALALVLVSVVSAAAATSLTSLTADNEARSVIENGDFESGAVSLSLSPVQPFPLVVGGWGVRGERVTQIAVGRRQPFSGQHALRIVTSARRPAHLLQDAPVGTRSFALQVAFLRIKGRQTLRLVPTWDRNDPDLTDLAAGPATGIAIELTPNGLRVNIDGETWRVDRPLEAGRWSRLSLVSDVRTGQLLLSIDDDLVASLPAVPALAPQTLILGGTNNTRGLPGTSRYRYDAIELLRLHDVELAELLQGAQRSLPQDLSGSVMHRLESAVLALANGSPRLATPELRAASRIIERAERQTIAAGAANNRASLGQQLEDLATLRVAAGDLIALLNAS